jgi:hypothetical protein
LRRVAEYLGDAGAHGRARYGEIDIDAESRCIGVTVVRLQQQRSGARLAGLDEGRLNTFRRPDRLEAQE